MKKIVITLILAITMIGTVAAQNNFKGIVKYKVESTGQVDMKIPDEAAVAEIKVSGNNLFTKSAIFQSTPFTECIVVNGLTETTCNNFSQLLGFLRGQGNEFTYEGSGKIILKHTYTTSSLDSVYVVDKEAGHFYYEKVDGETKTIIGYNAKKIIRHTYDADGIDHPQEIWYTDEIGPEYNIIFTGLPGIPLQCTIDAGEGRALTYTATEVIKGKVKDVDFLLPDGYESLNESDLKTLMEEIQDAIELMQED